MYLYIIGFPVNFIYLPYCSVLLLFCYSVLFVCFLYSNPKGLDFALDYFFFLVLFNCTQNSAVGVGERGRQAGKLEWPAVSMESTLFT